jgi:hypothetical protein
MLDGVVNFLRELAQPGPTLRFAQILAATASLMLFCIIISPYARQELGPELTRWFTASFFISTIVSVALNLNLLLWRNHRGEDLYRKRRD